MESFCIELCPFEVGIPMKLEDSDITHVTFIFPIVSLNG